MESHGEPYRLFFPLGLLFGIWATLVWILYVCGFSHSYPGPFHANIMIGGFVFAFVLGFLLTAVPRLTKTDPVRKKPLALFVMLYVLSMAGAVSEVAWLFHGGLTVTLGALLAFFGGRLRQGDTRHRDLPSTFPFVGLGLIAALLGQMLLLGVAVDVFSESLLYPGKALFNVYMLCGLILGVGSALVPAILGHQPFPGTTDFATAATRRRRIPWEALLLFVFALGSELAGAMQLASICLLATTCYVAIGHWKLHRLPVFSGPLPYGTWSACWTLVGGLFLNAFYPQMRIHALHIVFIGGFGLLTVMVASQVLALHESKVRDLKSKALWFVMALILFAALTRYVAPLTGGSYLNHLAYAASVWVIALVVWAGLVPYGPRRALLARCASIYPKKP